MSADEFLSKLNSITGKNLQGIYKGEYGIKAKITSLMGNITPLTSEQQEAVSNFENTLNYYKSQKDAYLTMYELNHVKGSTRANYDTAENYYEENHDENQENRESSRKENRITIKSNEGSKKASVKNKSYRTNNSLNYCTNMLGNYVGTFQFNTYSYTSSFQYMNLMPTKKIISSFSRDMSNDPKAYYKATPSSNNNIDTSFNMLLEILTLNKAPFYSVYQNTTCPIFQVVNGLIVTSELFSNIAPNASYLVFNYSSSNNLINASFINGNQSPKWSWVRIYENENNEVENTGYSTTGSGSVKQAYLYYVYTDDESGPQTSFLYPKLVPDYCPDGIILPWTIYLYDNNDNQLYTINANQGASNTYESVFSTIGSMGKTGSISIIGRAAQNAIIEKLGYNPSQI